MPFQLDRRIQPLPEATYDRLGIFLRIVEMEEQDDELISPDPGDHVQAGADAGAAGFRERDQGRVAHMVERFEVVHVEVNAGVSADRRIGQTLGCLNEQGVPARHSCEHILLGHDAQLPLDRAAPQGEPHPQDQGEDDRQGAAEPSP